MTVSNHEKQNHENELFHCEQCEYSSPRKDILRQHIRSKHMEKNVKCDQCDFVTDRNSALKKHVNAMHVIKECNEGGRGGPRIFFSLIGILFFCELGAHAKN